MGPVFCSSAALSRLMFSSWPAISLETCKDEVRKESVVAVCCDHQSTHESSDVL